MFRNFILARGVAGLFLSFVGMNLVLGADLYVTAWNNGLQKPQFGKIDSSTGIYTELNADMGTGFQMIEGLAWNPAINQFNILSTNGVLNTISTTGVVGSPVATGLPSGSLLAYDSNGATMYMVNNSGLNTLNPTTGSYSLVGSLGVFGVRAPAIQNGSFYLSITDNYMDLAFFGSLALNNGAITQISNKNVFYNIMLLASDGTTLFGYESSKLYTINPTTGAATFLTNVTGAPSVLSMSAIPVPEPSTSILGAVAMSVMFCVGRRRWVRQG